MSITDELREYVRHYSVAGSSKDKTLTAIADRIDIAHKHAIGYVDDRDPETMAEHGWVRKEEGKTISAYYVDVVPRFDWKLMALELEQFAEIVRGMAGDDE